LFLLFGFLLGIWAVPRFGRIRMQVIGFAGMTCGMMLLMIAVYLSNSSLHVPLVFTGFILFNLLMERRTEFHHVYAGSYPLSDSITGHG
jgi:MFS transporter, putative metabolite transport protein